MPVIHFRHCERSAAIHGCAFPTMDRHGLRPRDDEGILVISTSLSHKTWPTRVFGIFYGSNVLPGVQPLNETDWQPR